MILIDLRWATVAQRLEAYEASQAFTGYEIRDSIIHSLNKWEGINGILIHELSDPEITTTTNVVNFINQAREIWNWKELLPAKYVSVCLIGASLQQKLETMKIFCKDFIPYNENKISITDQTLGFRYDDGKVTTHCSYEVSEEKKAGYVVIHWTSILMHGSVPYVNNTFNFKTMKLSEQVKSKYFDKPEVKLAAETVAEELNEADEKYSDLISKLNGLHAQVETFKESLDSAYENKDRKEFDKLLKSFKEFKETQNATLLELVEDML